MASHLSSRISSPDHSRKRRYLRRAILESLERRELLAVDSAGVVFAPGTPQDYMDAVLGAYLRGENSPLGEGGSNYNAPGVRWTNPVGGAGPNAGDPATVTWSIVPDGTVDSAGGVSNLVTFMDSIYGGGTGAVQNRSWFGIFQRAYDRWSELSGLTFVYEGNDDGAPMGGTNRGVDGVRGDVRIGGHNIDGNFGTLAFNYFPNNGGDAGFDGDMIIDTNDVFYFNNANGPFGENRGLSNVLMHESGHGIGLLHTIPVDGTKLMEPTASFAFLGPQHDDILGVQSLYGDDAENDDAKANATDLGELANGLQLIDGQSINAEGDDDWFTFSVPSAGKISIVLEPVGKQYSVGNQGGTTAPVDTLRNMDLSFQVLDGNGTVLANVNQTGAGEIESINDLDLLDAGNYSIKIAGQGTAGVQLYSLSLRVSGVSSGFVGIQPRLLSIAPNSGSIFSFNSVNTLTEAPTELVFRFDGASDIDPATLAGGIRVVRSGGDGQFGDGNEVTLIPGYVGFGDNNRIVVMRFAETLGDDLYRVAVYGVDDAANGITAIKSTQGVPLLTRSIDSTPNDLTRDSIDFNLELGSLVMAVVPQPVDRLPNGTLDPQRDKIRVYFNNDDLYASSVTTGDVAPNPTVVDPAFYQLILTNDSVQPGDDTVFLPTSISYDPATDMAELTFSGPIDTLAGAGSYRLRIGTNEQVVSNTNPSNVTVLSPADPTGTISGAFPLGTLSSGFSTVINQSILTTSTNVLPLDFPGGMLEIGHRDIQDETHLNSGGDASPRISTILYNLALSQPYGTDAAGRPLNTAITSDQIQRVREIFEFYSSILGIDFIETESSGLTVVTGDLAALGEQSAPGGIIGLAGSGLAIMDGAEVWDNSFGGRSGIPGAQSYFETAMHEIGHLLGLGHTYDQPPGTIMGDAGELADPNPGLNAGLEWNFPGDIDIIHGQNLFRPDNRDVDTYSFTVPVGQSGSLTAETIAERLANSSNLDTYITLMKQTPEGFSVVAVNNDSVSSDSFLKADLTPGNYFISVTGKGNEDFNAAIDNTGSGAVSEGNYQLKLDFVPTPKSITDTTGTALDGDGDGKAGGHFDFWFRTASPVGVAAAGQPKTIFVDKGYTGVQTGSPTQPMNNLNLENASKWPVGLLQPGDIIRVVGSVGTDGDVTTAGDNPAFEIGRGGVGNVTLSDGLSLQVPRGVTVMVDAGAIFKLQSSRITVGSTSASIDRSFSSFQVLGTPNQSVIFTSYNNQAIGVDTNPLNTVPRQGDWGGIDFHNDVDRDQGLGDWERRGIFLNYVAFADMTYGGGQVTVTTPSPVVNPINLTESRPTILNNTIRLSADAAIAADPNSFEETRFTSTRYQLAEVFHPDYTRVGPNIHGNKLLANSTNGLFVKTATAAGSALTTLEVAARFDDTDITYVLGENLIISGTPGGSFLEQVAPDVSLVQKTDLAGGTLTVGDSVRYKVTFVDSNGSEGLPSTATSAHVLSDTAVRLDLLPVVNKDFVGRRLWRSTNGGNFTLVAELDGDTQTYVDRGANLSAIMANPNATSLSRPRLDARLQIDPGVVIKSSSSRIEVGIGAQLIAEGTADRPIVFTSRFDDRFGAAGTFDTNNDGTDTNPSAGDWAGLVARHLSSMSIDNALITFGGGVASISGGFAGFNAVEVHQAEARIANSRLEMNASGVNGNANNGRDGRAVNDTAVIFVSGAQPVIVNNTIQNNSVNNTAAISINANALSNRNVVDAGRQTGTAQRVTVGNGNAGPLVDGNLLVNNGLNGLRVRGETLTTETVWDDTDIVHILQSEVIVPDFHTFGGLRLQSKSDESLVVKLQGAGAGITALGRPLDITDRIGGSVQVLGTPGFPVVLTSLADDSVGAGFDPTGRALVDTNNNGFSTGRSGDWRSIRLDPYANDRNVDVTAELETDQIQESGTNDDVNFAQTLGALANTLSGGDENLRLGFTVNGTVAAPQDLDVYSFTATAGTSVWIDIDRTSGSLDSVVELLDASGQILAQSDNSLRESAGTESRFVSADTSKIKPEQVMELDSDVHAVANSFDPTSDQDLYSVNPLDAGMRIVLPGTAGSINNYFIRVRSSNVGPGQSTSRLQDPSLEREGLSQGNYRLQVRMQQTDEIAGSTIRYADIRYATVGIEANGMPAHSQLLGQLTSNGTNTNLGNIFNSDLASVTVAGNLGTAGTVEFYTFEVNRSGTQTIPGVSGTTHLSTILDIDYADGFGRPDTALWVFDSQNRLVLIGTDSNVADDRAAPLNGADVDDLSRGSMGARDPFIGASELPAGTYTVAVTNNSQIAATFDQYQNATATNPLVRLEPVNSVNRISVDRFEPTDLVETTAVPTQVAFSQDIEGTHAVPWTLADVTTYVIRDQGTGSRLVFANAMTGAIEADISNFVRMNDAAMSPDGRLVGYEVPNNNVIDANSGNFHLINSIGAAGTAAIPNNASTASGSTGIQTYTTQATSATAFAIQQRDHTGFGNGNQPEGDGFIINGLTMFYADNTQLKMFGVGSRVRQQSFNLPLLDANGGVTGILPDLGSGAPVRVFNTTNIVYKLDPTSGAAINPGNTPVQDRTGNGLLSSTNAGTQKVEFGRFLSGTLADNFTSGTVTGLTSVGSQLFAVSNLGEFYAVNVGNGNNGFGSDLVVNTGPDRFAGRLPLTTILDPDTNTPIAFSGLTTGPRDLEGGRFANILFGTTADGTIYALDTQGVLQPVFPGFNVKIKAPTSASIGANIKGIEFSPLDVNLWHLSQREDNTAGHGRTIPFDSSMTADVPGDFVAYFGFEAPTQAFRQPGNWSNLFDVAAYQGTYDLPGGAHGAIVSNPIDLRSYSADDLPMLYFNYKLATEGANSDLNDGDVRMNDAFRVYASGEDGNWALLTTNNTARDAGADRTGQNGNSDEFDTAFNGGNVDAFGNFVETQETFDTNEWRQARTSLASFAGQDNVRLRFEFSTGATFRTGDSLRGGIELTAVEGAKLTDGETITVTTQDGATTQVLEFDLGLVLNLPGGASLLDGTSAIDFNGTVATFSTTDNTGNNVQYLASDSPSQIAARLRARLPAILGITAADIQASPLRSNVLNIANLAVGNYAVTDLPTAVIEGTPGIAGDVAINVHQAMTITQVRDAVRQSLAIGFNNPNSVATANAGPLDAWPVYGDTLRIFNFTVVNNSAMSLTSTRVGDQFGVQNAGLSRLDERAQNNAFEGLYIDDIIIGLAERGEMVFNAAASNAFVANQQYDNVMYANVTTPQIETGRYQLTVRAAADYGTTDDQTGDLFLNPGFPPFIPDLGRSIDTNARLSQSVGIQVASNAPGNIADGTTFTLSDGHAPVTFEFDVTVGAGDPAAGVASGNIPVVISTNSSAVEIATAIRDAINSTTSQLKLGITASLTGEMIYGGGFGDAAPSGSTVIALHGPAASDEHGNYAFPANSFLQPIVWGGETSFGEDLGDGERPRPQGQVLLTGNTITDSSDYGIVATAGVRVQNPFGGTVGDRPYPGSPLNLPTPNTSQLAPGVVIINNILAYNVAGGLRITGDPGTDAPVQIARVINNTIYGTGTGNGILIENGASPTILNTIIANTGVGVNAPPNSSAVLGANIFQNNGVHTANVGIGSLSQVLGPTEPLFVDTTNRRFYLAPGSKAIDSSLEALQERPALSQVRNSLSLPVSPMLAPDVDVTGQRRVDDPNVNSPAGLGGNVFKDRGAVDRSDFIGLDAIILQPQDNDSLEFDIDRTSTFIQLIDGQLEFFSILLKDTNGTGPDPATVLSGAVALTENGRLLVDGVDYIFGYNANSRTIHLTPVAGIWRSDSVYEITLNNELSHKLSLPPGNAANDGDTYTITGPGGTRVFELDNNNDVVSGSISIPYSLASSSTDISVELLSAINSSGLGVVAYVLGDAIVVRGAASVVTSGSSITSRAVGAIADLAGNPLFANRSNSLTQFTILMPDVALDFGDARFPSDPLGVSYPTISIDSNGKRTIDASRHALLPLDAPLLVLGSFVDAESDGRPNASATGDDAGSMQVTTTIPGATISVAGAATYQAQAATAAVDGQVLVITDARLKTVSLEFDIDPDPGTVAVGNFRIPVSSAATADEVASALAAAVNGLVQSGQITGLAAVAEGDLVSLGGSRDHLFDASGAPILTRVSITDFDLTLPTGGFADGQTISLTDGSGLQIVFELDDIASPGVVGDNLPIVLDLTNTSSAVIVNAIANAMNTAVVERRIAMALVVVNGQTIELSTNDEDGVSFGGLFNSQLEPVPVTVTSSGAGILDAWVDWNADGDFDDSGEHVATSMAVHAGENLLNLSTPASAPIGFTYARFRLSTEGNSIIGGIGIGGEVEDYLIEITAGLPPIAVVDNYSVDEDSVLNVTAPGILTNDSDADSSTIEVFDENPFIAGVQPIVDVQFGTLILNADGSFTYTPNHDFFGIDTFVYNVTDGRLQAAQPATVTITVNPINDTPTAIDDEITILEDEAIIRSGADFTANDYKGVLGEPSQINELGQTLEVVAAVILHPNPSVVGGSLSIVNNELTYTPPAHYNDNIDGPVLIELTIRDGGTAGASAMPLESKSILTIHLTAVNDAPEYSMPDTTGAIEDQGLVTVPDFVTSILPGPSVATDEGTGPALSFEDQQVSFVVTALNPDLFDVLPAITATTDSSPGTLTYQLKADVNADPAFGEILVEVVAVDTGLDGGANGDINHAAARTFTILPTNVNDAPEFEIPASTDSLEDQGEITVVGFLTDARPGPTTAWDEASQTLTISISADSNAFTAAGFPHIVFDASTGIGDLVYETAPHVNQYTGQSFEVVVTVMDDGGTALGGVDRTSKTFTINVTELNDAPEFDMPVFTSAYQEDPNADPLAPTVVPNFITNILPGPAAAIDEGPAREDQHVSFIVTALDPTLFDPAFLPVIDDAGQLTYRLSPDVNQMNPFPEILVEVIAIDTGANDNTTDVPRNINQADARTFTILPDPINDAPEFTIPASIDSIEDEGLITVADFVTGARPGPITALDELANQKMTVLVEALDPTAFSVQPQIVLDEVLGTGVLTYQTNSDVNSLTGHDLRIRVTIQDDGGVNNPGDVDTTIKTFSLNVAEINDSPSFDLPVTDITLLEDNEQETGVSPTVLAGFATNIVAGPATALDETTHTATKQSWSFETVSVSDPSLFSVQPVITATGDLVFTTAKDQNGQAVVVVRLHDSGPGTETGNGDDNTSHPDQTFTINLTAVNDPPEFTLPTSLNVREDQGLVTVPNFATNLRPGPTTAGDEAGQTYTVHVQAIDPTAFAIQPTIGADGTLTFRTAADANSTMSNHDFSVAVFLTDDGATSPAPNNNTSVTKTFVLNVAAINDAPSFVLPSTQVTVIEDNEEFLGITQTSVLSFATNIARGPATATDEVGQTVAFEILEVSAPELFEVQPAISSTGELTFTTANNKNGKALVVVQLKDSGVGSPFPNINTSNTQTFTITLTPINDAPQFSMPATITVAEDAGLVTQGQFAQNVRRGPIGADDENSQTLSFQVVAIDPTAFAVQPTMGVDGTLTFQTAENVNSANADLRVTVRLVDNGVNSPAPNANSSALQTFTVIANPVNDPPIPDAIELDGVEDTPLEILSSLVLIGDLPGPTPDETESVYISQVQRSSGQGGRVEPVLDANNHIVSFTYTPPANFSGSDTFLYVATDTGTPSKSGTGTITINLSGVNDPPQFTRGINPIVTEDAGDVILNQWATNILAGPGSAADELANQTVTFQVSVDPAGQALFAVQPTLTSDGTLQFKPALDANGTALVEVIAVDDGNPVMSSAPQTFTVTITPANDPPVFSSGGNVTVNEDSGAFSQPWATNIAPAAGILNSPQTALDEVNQVVDFHVVADRPIMFSVQPTVSSSGVLAFTPADNAFGTAIITVTAVDRGPSGNGNQNSSVPTTFTINLAPVNDIPVAVDDHYQGNENSLLNVAAKGLLLNDTDIDFPNDTLSVVAETLTSTFGAVVVVNADGSFSYDPTSVDALQQLVTGQSVGDTFTYRVQDSTGAMSIPATATITVAGIDDAPVAVDDNYSVGVDSTALLSVRDNDTDVDNAIDAQSVVLTSLPAFGTAVVTSTGSVRYTPGAGFRGQDTFSYTVRDVGGNVSNEATVIVNVNSAPLAQDDTAFTYKNESVDIHVLANDIDPDGSINPSSVEIVAQPLPSGTAEVLPDGMIRFTPVTGFSGQVTLSYVVSDNLGTVSNIANVRIRVQNSKWQNPSGPMDVNGDGFISPIDALIIINYLNSGLPTSLPDANIVPPPFLDTSGNESVEPQDVLIIINYLNSIASGGGGVGEGEADVDTLFAPNFAMMVSADDVLRTVGQQVVSEIKQAFDNALWSEAEALTYDNTDGQQTMVGGSCSIEESEQTSTQFEESVDDFFGSLGPYLPE